MIGKTQKKKDLNYGWIKKITFQWTANFVKKGNVIKNLKKLE